MSAPQIIYGKNALIEVVRARRRPIEKIYLANRAGEIPADLMADLSPIPNLQKKLQWVDRQVLNAKAGTEHHQGVAAQVGAFVYDELETLIKLCEPKGILLMGDSLQDPNNLGAMIRSAVCFGVKGLILNKDHSLDITPAVVKASAGATESIRVARVVNLARALEDLKENGFWSYAADPTGGESLDKVEPAQKSVIVIGNEGEGIRRLVRQNCDFGLTIPMAGKFESLNAAQAATVLCYTFSVKIR